HSYRIAPSATCRSALEYRPGVRLWRFAVRRGLCLLPSQSLSPGYLRNAPGSRHDRLPKRKFRNKTDTVRESQCRQRWRESKCLFQNTNRTRHGHGGRCYGWKRTRAVSDSSPPQEVREKGTTIRRRYWKGPAG